MWMLLLETYFDDGLIHSSPISTVSFVFNIPFSRSLLKQKTEAVTVDLFALFYSRQDTHQVF